MHIEICKGAYNYPEISLHRIEIRELNHSEAAFGRGVAMRCHNPHGLDFDYACFYHINIYTRNIHRSKAEKCLRFNEQPL